MRSTGESGTATAPKAEDLSRMRGGSPAKLRQRLAGDLDVIVLMALRKEPQHRYSTVEQFAEDIRRHLEGLPVTARRDSWKYRAGKFAIRHKLAVIATALILTAVLGGVAATVREARIAAANERRAEQRFNDVRKLANSLMFEIHDAIRDLPGSTSARRLLVTRALEYLDSLSDQSKDDVSLQKELASAYERVGDVLGFPYGANLGDKPGALQSYRKALAIRESLAVANPNDAPLRRDLVEIYYRVALVLESGGNFKEALEAVSKGRKIARAVAPSNNDPGLADQYAGGYYFTAGLQVQTGDLATARDNYQHAAAIREAALLANPGNLSLRTHLAADYAGIAKCSEQERDLAHAIEMQTKAVAILGEVSKSNPGNATFSEYLGEARIRWRNRILASVTTELPPVSLRWANPPQPRRFFASPSPRLKRCPPEPPVVVTRGRGWRKHISVWVRLIRSWQRLLGFRSSRNANTGRKPVPPARRVLPFGETRKSVGNWRAESAKNLSRWLSASPTPTRNWDFGG